MKTKKREWWKCSRCKRLTRDCPAISRRDNRTEVCRRCGTMEALLDWARYMQSIEV